MRFILGIFSHVRDEVVFDADGRSLFSRLVAVLQNDGRRSGGRQLERERVSVAAQLLEQTVLNQRVNR